MATEERLIELEIIVEGSMALPCYPPEACATHGRCWTHSEWADAEATEARELLEQRLPALESLATLDATTDELLGRKPR